LSPTECRLKFLSKRFFAVRFILRSVDLLLKINASLIVGVLRSLIVGTTDDF